jgi:hypothetical protein
MIIDDLGNIGIGYIVIIFISAAIAIFNVPFAALYLSGSSLYLAYALAGS